MHHKIGKKILIAALIINSIDAYATASVNLEDSTRSPKYKITSISKNDERNIKSRAKSAVSRFMDVLNIIATGLDLDMAQAEDIIRSSYSAIDKKVFFDSAVIIEDDLRKIEDVKLSKQKAVYSYLKDFEIFYKKTDSATVSFSNFRMSNVKQGNYLYIKVFYDCLFTGQSKISNEPYTVQKRVAELRVEKLSNKWKAWVVDVHFEDSTDVANETKDDVPVTDDDAGKDSLTVDNERDSAFIANKTNFADPAERERFRKMNDSIRTYMAFRLLIDSGKYALNGGRYIAAYQFFNEAETVTNGSDGVIRENDRQFLQTMITETRRNIDISHRTPDQLFNDHLQQATLRKNQRKYDQAVEFYNKALTIKPDNEDVKNKKKALITSINNLTRLDGKYIAGNYREAIVEYTKAISSDPGNSDYYVGRGKCYDKVKDTKKALADCNKAIELDENNIEAHKQKAAIYERQRLYADAIASHTVCLSIDKTDISGYLKIAALNMAARNTDAALAVLDKGISYNPTNPTLHFARGELLYDLKSKKLAAQSFDNAVHYDSSNARLFFLRGLCNVELGEITQAGSDFVTARRLGIDGDQNMQTLTIAGQFYKDGLAHLKAGNHQDALRSLINSSLIDPGNIEYRFRTGQLNYSNRHYDDAIKNFSGVIDLDPKNAEAYQMRGLSKYKKGMARESISDFENALRVNPKMGDVLKHTGDAYLSLKDYRSAIRKYEESLKNAKSRKHGLTDSLEASLYLGMGIALYNINDYKKALEKFNHSIDINGKRAEAFYHRGITLIKVNQLGNAEENILKALKTNPDQPEWLNALGEVYYQKNLFDKAREQFERAIARDTSLSIFPDPLYQRANCLIRQNDYQAALNDYQTILLQGLDKKYVDFDASLGHAFLYLEQVDSAMVYFNKQLKKGLNATALYGMAVLYSQKPDSDQAFTWLEKALATGKMERNIITGDKRLTALKKDKRFKALMKKYY